MVSNNSSKDGQVWIDADVGILISRFVGELLFATTNCRQSCQGFSSALIVSDVNGIKCFIANSPGC